MQQPELITREAALRVALAARSLPNTTLPQLIDVLPYADGDMPDSVRVVIASDIGMTLSGHFGSCLRFLVYQVSATDSRLIGIRSALEADFAKDKNAFRAQIIGDCHVVYIVSVGGPAAAKIIRANIYPIKRPEDGTAEAVIAEFQRAMTNSPPPWMLKILGVSAEQRLKNYAAVEVPE